MSYFRYFPNRTNYDIILENESKTDERNIKISFADFFRSVALVYPKIEDGKFFYQNVKILDGERPDQVSNRLYNSANYWWTFFLLNEHLMLGEALQWPLSEYDIRQKADIEYSGLTLVFPKEQFCPEGEFPFQHFSIGERIIGQTSGINAIIKGFRPKFGQMLVDNIISQTSSYDFRDGEDIVGQTSGGRLTIQMSTLTKYAVYQYVDVETGRDVDVDTYIYTDELSSAPVGSTTGSISFEENLVIQNDRFRNIRSLKPESARLFADHFRKLIRKKVFT